MHPLLNIIICILLPPLAVIIRFGFGKDFIINLILTFFFYIPGAIHALWLTTK
ncbi:YqaE/Pmp3 family membrane protein [Psychromonas sp. psych-6C06]|uniref:YqaE/Pmp3 family membrane protein n=1 Tax=Psychromonas sp. psych-6C06 TaxID=2058089 RepID=UPI000C3487B1|nr:YqaE/Pmp3 family membrane protein [Psychromonas sp. psych-6C06]PKF61024.1 YqaE/Pmp3 family membrane protein [Psychromonas sp. psych-6C06]